MRRCVDVEAQVGTRLTAVTTSQPTSQNQPHLANRPKTNTNNSTPPSKRLHVRTYIDAGIPTSHRFTRLTGSSLRFSFNPRL